MITDSELNFTLELPSGFVSRPDLVGAVPNITYVFQYGEASEEELPILLFIEKMGGFIGRQKVTPKDMPPGFQGEFFTTQWQGFEVQGFKVPESANGIDTFTYNVQIPLKKEAIQIKLFGQADRVETLKPLLKQVLEGLQGESNWLTSAAPSSVANSESYGTTLLIVGIAGVVLGFVLLWLLSRHSPKGTVLLIAIVLYVISWQMEDVRAREVRLFSGCLRMLGFAGGILGVVDLLRKRDPSPSLPPSDESEPK
ncbi:hypothetical protein C5Y97_23100 [Blastopirellula marina]|uniref:Uncharacterized protein n=2 Tax=Blastopirellula marina TaxID=124 RepID=A0A2S8F934_9BACT|nr:hypothetical protein C5Y98_23090 [Blastopirellula marina]PTL41946.1 hypothetical protein C5Y97_23100 [Blastopirellula marina]